MLEKELSCSKADHHQFEGTVSTRWIPRGLPWKMSRGCATDNVGADTTISVFEFLKTSCLWSPTYPGCHSGLLRDLLALKPEWTGGTSWRVIQANKNSAITASLAELCSESWLCCQTQHPEHWLWWKGKLVLGAGQSWAKEAGSAGHPLEKWRLDWHFYLLLMLSWV